MQFSQRYLSIATVPSSRSYFALTIWTSPFSMNSLTTGDWLSICSDTSLMFSTIHSSTISPFVPDAPLARAVVTAGSMESTSDPRLPSTLLPATWASYVDVTAPQRSCPSTITSRAPRCSIAYSMDPSWCGATTLPATRITNISPRPWLKIISGGRRESEQVIIIAKGCWPRATSWRVLTEASLLSCSVVPLLANFSLPSMSIWSAFSGSTGVIMAGVVFAKATEQQSVAAMTSEERILCIGVSSLFWFRVFV